MNIGKKQLSETEFDILWGSIKHELYKLFYDTKCSALVVYNNIYIICTSPDSKYVESLYWKIGDFIYERAREMRVGIYKAEEWIREYNAGFRKFKYYVSCMNELCDFLSQYISAKSLEGFAFILWERCILQTTQKYKGTTLGQALVGGSKEEEVKEAIESLKCVVVDAKNPLLYYVQRYEQYALEKIKRKYEGESTPQSIMAYARYVHETVEGERRKREKIFLEESYEKLEMILEDILVTQKKKFIQGEVYRLLSSHQLPVQILDTIRDSGSRTSGNNLGKGSSDKGISGKGIHFTNDTHTHSHYHPIGDFYALYNTRGKVHTLSSPALEEVSKVFGYLRVVRNSYEMMRTVLVKYITSQLETHFHLLDRRIETLYVFYCMFKEVVEVGFDSDSGCFRVFEGRFSEVLNKLKPSLSTRLIDFSTSIVSKKGEDECCMSSPFLEQDGVDDDSNGVDYMSAPFIPSTTNNPSHTDNPTTVYRDGAILRVFSSLFGLIQDKNDFSERYIYELARRLVAGTSDFHKERHLLHIIKRGSTSDSLRKAEIMLGDISTCTQSSTIESSSTLLLTQCAWPLEYSPYNPILPPFFSQLVHEKEQRNPKRKLSWLWEYSTVLVDLDGVDIRLNSLQYFVLELFNSNPILKKEEISRRTNLSGNTLQWVLTSLYRSDILVEKEDAISLSPRPHKPNPYDYFIKENLFLDHDINKLIYYQSFISKTLKKHKHLTFSSLYSKLVAAHTDRFPLDTEELYRSIKGLLEKEILEEVPGSPRAFRYVP